MSQLQVTGEAKIRDIQGPVVANDGVVTALDGAASQYVRGDGTLADFPTSSGGGSSVSYYLNSSVSQGTIGGVAYRELSKDPIIGTGTDIAISSNGYVANYITDVNDPDVTIVAGGNFNCEFYFSVNNNSGNPTTYAELYKYDGTTFTLLGSNVGVPESINQGTTIAPYYFAIPVATASLALTDRLAIRIYVNVSGRTVTLHTENGHLCQVVTTLSKGMVSLNNLTDQSQFLTTGTSGTNFAIASSGDTHTFNLPVASATNTGKLSSTDWSTFNNKQNTITDPITGTGASGNVAYFNGTTSITSENSFNYDASTNRLGVNTSVPNATIGANAATDSGYSLLVKNDNANYNGIGFATDSTYGNLISTEKLGTALTRNLTLLNQSGYVSLTEAGNLGVGILTPNTGLDIYNGTSAYLWLHTANSGITGTDGVRLALFSTNGANLRNYEGAFSITAEGDFSIITIGAENFRVNSADGSIYQSKVANAMLKSVSGVITAAVANTDYQSPITLTTSGSSGASTFTSNTLNVPNYTLSGLGGVPTSRTLTINGTAYDLSADRSWTVGTIGGSGVSGRVAYYDGTNSITSEAGFIYDASTNRLGVNTSVPNATIGGDSALDSGYGLLIKTGASNYNGIGIAIDSTYGNLISTEKLGTASARNLTLLNQSGFVSLTESGNLGLNVLTPAVSGNGIDIYGSTSVGLRFHTATSGTTVSDGAGINFSAANNLGITNYEAGTIDIVTNGNSGVYIASNGYVGINGATPSVALTVTGAISQTSVTSSLLKTDSGGLLVAAVAGTDYVIPSALSGYVPTSRTLTINGTSYDLSANRSWTISSGVSGTTDYIPKFTSSTTIGNSAITDDGTTVTLISRVLAAPRARLNNGFDNASLTLNIGGQTYMDSRTSRLYQTFNLSSISNYMHIYDPYSSVNANGGFSIGSSSSITLLPSTSIIHFDGVNNRVGIGTTAPSATLSVNGASNFSSSVTIAAGNFILGGTSRLLYSNGSTVNNIYSGGSDGLRVMNQADSAILVTIANTGAATFSSTLSATNDLTINAALTPLIFLNTTSTGKASGIITQESGTSKWGFGSSFGSGDGTFNIYNYTAGARFLTITSGGDVGIGTTGGINVASGWTNLTANGSTTGIIGVQIAGTNFGAIYGNLANNNFVLQAYGTSNTGNMVFLTNSNERMRITSGGNVGIGMTGDATVRLFVKGADATSSNYALDLQNSSSVDLFYVRNDGQIVTGTLSASPYNNSQTGRTAILASNGILGYLVSTRESKANIETINNIDFINNLNPVQFNYRKKDDKNNTFTNELETNITYGFIADEVEKINKDLVFYKEDGVTLAGVEYNSMIAILTKAVQELKAEIDELKNK